MSGDFVHEQASCKLALTKRRLQLMLEEDATHLSQEACMGSSAGPEDNDVVQINHETLYRERLKVKAGVRFKGSWSS